MKSATKKTKAPKGKAEGDDTTTLSVSPYFRDMIGDLAKARGVGVREFCDTRGVEVFGPDYAPLLKAKLAKVGG